MKRSLFWVNSALRVLDFSKTCRASCIKAPYIRGEHVIRIASIDRVNSGCSFTSFLDRKLAMRCSKAQTKNESATFMFPTAGFHFERLVRKELKCFPQELASCLSMNGKAGCSFISCDKRFFAFHDASRLVTCSAR